MRRKTYLLIMELLLIGCLLNAQSTPEAKLPSATLLKAGRFLDVRTGHYIEAAGILIEGDRIKEVGQAVEIVIEEKAGKAEGEQAGAADGGARRLVDK